MTLALLCTVAQGAFAVDYNALVSSTNRPTEPLKLETPEMEPTRVLYLRFLQVEDQSRCEAL